jgi:hypothetical protein
MDNSLLLLGHGWENALQSAEYCTSYDLNLYDDLDWRFETSSPIPKTRPDFVPFDGCRYQSVELDLLPPSRASEPVTILTAERAVECVMITRVIGMKVKSSGQQLHGRSGETGLDTISVERGWWMEEKKKI